MLEKAAADTLQSYRNSMNGWKINEALKGVWTFVRSMNKYIDVTMPWVLAKSQDKAPVLDAVLYHLCEGLRITALMAEPFIPIAAEKIWNQLGLRGFAEAALKDGVWGGLPEGTQTDKGDPIFPRIEPEDENDENQDHTQPAETPAEEKAPLISIDEFMKTDLRIAEILTAEKVRKSKKLICMTVSLGDEVRTVVSGIAQYYEPEQLIGKHVIFVSNLKPAKLMGIESQGMILAASKDGKLQVPFVDMPAGSHVK
jgi:methionyl-tRNA synthetase